MCGLVGIVGNGITQVDTKVLKQLIHVDSLRGHHSTGLASVDAGGQISYFKKAVDGPDFLQMKPTEDLIRVTNLVMFAHNRYATKGARNSANAHPFEHEHIVLAHNGTLRKTHNLPDHLLFDVDSDNLAYAFSQKPAAQVIPTIDGAFALTWYDSKAKTFNIIRNEERPMCMVRHKTRDVVYYASERKMLEMVLDRNDIDTGEYFELGVGKMISWQINGRKIEKPVITKHEVCEAPKYTTTTYNYGTGNGYYSGGRRAGTFQSGPELLRGHKLCIGDEIEFYSTGVDLVSSISPSGPLVGTMTSAPFAEVKIYNQSPKSLAGYYTARISSASEVGGKLKIVCHSPKLTEIVEGDANNEGKEHLVAEVLKTDEERKAEASASKEAAEEKKPDAA